MLMPRLQAWPHWSRRAGRAVTMGTRLIGNIMVAGVIVFLIIVVLVR